MEKGMFSVIVPVYNVEQFLPRCIESVLKQIYYKYELILVDDGSTDQSGAICEEYADKYSCCKVIHQKNKGPSSARNRGLDEARGEYICFIDVDDYIEKELLTKVSYYLGQGYDMVSFCASRVNEQGEWLYEIIPNEDMTKEFDFFKADKKAFILRNFLEYEIGWEVWGAVYKRKLIDEAQLRFDAKLKYAEDKVFMLQYLLQSTNLIKLPDLLYNYTLRVGSLTDAREDIDEINNANSNFLYMKDMLDIDETVFYFSTVLYYYRLILQRRNVSGLIELLEMAKEQELQRKHYTNLKNVVQELKTIFNDEVGKELLQTLLIIKKGYMRK